MSKHWRLVVSDLSGETVHSDSVVEADNWITALRAGRKQLGEDGAVPTGSSVNVGPGTWTVLDAVGQRRFEVSTTDNPGGAEGAKPSAAEASSGDSAVPKKKRNATMAYIPADAVKAAREAVAEQNAENAEEPEAAGAGENEVVILAWATFPSKEVRDAANAKIMEDPRTAEICAASGDIFDCKKMAFAGFRPIVES